MKKSLLFLLFGALFFVACDKEDNTVLEDSSAYNIEGYILDADGNVPMEGVVVKGAFGETKTDAKGYFNVGGLNHGAYSLIFSADGYGQLKKYYTLKAVSENVTENPLKVDYTYSDRVELNKMDQSITTTIWKEVNNQLTAFANIPFTVELGEEYLYNKIEGTTDANGQIVLNDTLPNDEVTLKIEYVDATVGKVYKKEVTFTPSGISKSYKISGTDLSDDLYLLTSNIFDADGKTVSNLAVNVPLTFEFNQKIDSKTTVTLKNTSDSYIPVAFTVNITDKKLTITPIGNLTEANGFEVVIDPIVSEKLTFNFSTIGGEINLVKVADLSLQDPGKVFINDDSVAIQFKKVAGAQYYEFYGIYGTQTEFQKFETYYATSGTSAYEKTPLNLRNKLSGMVIPSSGLFDGNTFTIIVRAVAKNGNILGEFSDKLVVKRTEY